MIWWPGITAAVTANRIPFFTQGTLIAGLAEGYTLYGGTQLASRYTALAIGAGKTW
jgi:outer membrane usher protein FimD/PapC